MAETHKLFSVTDEKGTVLKPLEATYAVDYKYKEEEQPVRVLEGDVKRGQGVSAQEDFPQKDPQKDLEYSELRIEMKEPQGWNAYANKSKVKQFEVPGKGEDVKLEPIKKGKQTKEVQKEAFTSKLEKKIEILKSRYTPK